MRHWLLRAIPLLAVVPGIWTPLTFATPTLGNNRIDPATRVVSQQQQSGPQALSLSSIYRHSSPLVIPRAIAKRNGIFFQELTSDFLLHYYTFTAVTPSWPTASWLANFWYQLGLQLRDVPDHYFMEKVISFSSGPLKLELFNASGGTGGIPREFIVALANAMVSYTEKGFCGMFNARISSRGGGVGAASAGAKLWITFRIFEGFGGGE